MHLRANPSIPGAGLDDAPGDGRLRLGFLEALVLWALRADAHGAVDEALLRRALGRAGMDRAEGYLLGYLWTVRHGAFRRPALRGLADGCVGADERLLLDALGLVHAGEGLAAVLMLRGLLRPAATDAALSSLRPLTAIAALAGHPPQSPGGEVAVQFALPRALPTPTLH